LQKDEEIDTNGTILTGSSILGPVLEPTIPHNPEVLLVQPPDPEVLLVQPPDPEVLLVQPPNPEVLLVQRLAYPGNSRYGCLHLVRSLVCFACHFIIFYQVLSFVFLLVTNSSKLTLLLKSF
jgi:hypothetical protein